jgi:hypothetical protein
MADRKERFALISLFEKNCRKNYVPLPTINKYNEQWAADALLESFSFSDIERAMNHYFKVSVNPTWKTFANNVDKILETLRLRQEDDRLRAERRQKAKEWLSD